MNVLSLFDGMSCGRIALERAGIEVDNYYASELDKYAIKVTQANWPETIQLGDVTKWQEWDIDWSSIDLLIGGSPCQGFSFAGKQLAFDDPRSKLFFVYVDILNHIKWIRRLAGKSELKFMLENVKMKKEFLNVISEKLGVEPVFINSDLVSAQNRQRYYWANWDFEAPEDKVITWGDIREYNAPTCHYYSEKGHEWISRHSERTGKKLRVWGDNDKCQMLEASMFKNYSGQRFFGINDVHGLRYMSLLECERAQTVPDNATRTSIFIQNNETSKGIKKCGYVSSKNAISQSQAGKLNSAISTILDSLDTALPKDLESMSIKLKFVSVKGASADSKQLKVFASNITKNGKGSSLLTNQINAECAISLLGVDQKVIAPNIIANYSGTEIRLNQSKENLSRMAILDDDTLKLRMADGFIRSLLNMRSAENCEKERLCITLTLINTIILKAIYMCASQTPITCKFTGSLNALQGNSLEMELSSLEMASITETSNTNRYKMLGNGWTVDVIAHIFKSMN